MVGVVYKDGVEIDRGIYTGGKHKAPNYPDQDIFICDSCDAYNIENERSYRHCDGVSFQEIQDNEHVAYDSNEGVDRSILYPLPHFMTHNGPIPNHKHSLDDKGQETKQYLGGIK